MSSDDRPYIKSGNLGCLVESNRKHSPYIRHTPREGEIKEATLTTAAQLH